MIGAQLRLCLTDTTHADEGSVRRTVACVACTSQCADWGSGCLEFTLNSYVATVCTLIENRPQQSGPRCHRSVCQQADEEQQEEKERESKELYPLILRY